MHAGGDARRRGRGVLEKSGGACHTRPDAVPACDRQLRLSGCGVVYGCECLAASSHRHGGAAAAARPVGAHAGPACPGGGAVAGCDDVLGLAYVCGRSAEGKRAGHSSLLRPSAPTVGTVSTEGEARTSPPCAPHSAAGANVSCAGEVKKESSERYNMYIHTSMCFTLHARLITCFGGDLG